jgi:hypothetical protein
LATIDGERSVRRVYRGRGRALQEVANAMKAISLVLGLAGALAAGAALCKPSVNDTTSICLDPAGRSIPVTCQARPSRVEHEEYICQCLRGGEQVTIQVCPEGVRPPAESAAYERARRAAVRHGTLLGATYQGRVMCADRTDSLTGR